MKSSRRGQLEEVAKRFEAWRRTRSRGRGRIPGTLWRAAVALGGRYSASAICERLRLNPSRFREAREAAGSCGRRLVTSAPPAPQFVELPASALSSAPYWRVVIRQADLSVQLEFASADQSAVEAARRLVEALSARGGRA